jgi:hypothetical protein
VRIDQAHLVLELLGHALSSSVTAGQHCTGMANGLLGVLGFTKGSLQGAKWYLFCFPL